MLKDLKLAQEAAASAEANTPLGAAAARLYAPFNAAGAAGEDFCGIINSCGAGPDRRSACALDLIRRGLIEAIPRADRALQGFFR